MRAYENWAVEPVFRCALDGSSLGHLDAYLKHDDRPFRLLEAQFAAEEQFTWEDQKMSTSYYRNQLERKRKQRVDADRESGRYRVKESNSRTDAAKARQAAMKSTNPSTAKHKLREAERKEKEAEHAGKEANRWQTRAATYAKEEAALGPQLARAERSEADATERRRRRDQRQAEQRAAAERRAFESRIRGTESAVDGVIRQLPAPRPEKLRVLILGAASEGDLRVGREQKRIRSAVEAALHRDQIELDVRPAATTEDLLDGITGFRPHVVHFSGHSNDDLIVFEDERDEPHQGVVTTARAFANAIRATDTPPLLVLLNSCRSASQVDALVDQVVPFAIGMADSIEDSDAINYAARFYASVANGQSISSSHSSGRAALELAGLDGAELPTLVSAPDADPATTLLVEPNERAPV